MNYLKSKRLSWVVYNRGFSLVELLISFVLLLILTFFISFIIQVTIKAIQTSKAPLSVLEQTRVGISIMKSDILSMIVRDDMSYQFVGGNLNSGSDFFLKFLSDKKSPSGLTLSDKNRSLSMIGYNFKNIENKKFGFISRANRSLLWNESPFMGIRYDNQKTIIKLPQFNESDIEILIDGVVSVGIEFLKRYPSHERIFSNQAQINPGQRVSTAPERDLIRSENSEENGDPYQIAGVFMTLVIFDQNLEKSISDHEVKQIKSEFNIGENIVFEDHWKGLLASPKSVILKKWSYAIHIVSAYCSIPQSNRGNL